MFKRQLYILLLFLATCNFANASDTSFQNRHIYVNAIQTFDYFYLVKATDIENNVNIAIFSVKTKERSDNGKDIQVGDTLNICLSAKVVLEIAPGYIINYHPQSKWTYQNRIILDINQGPFVSNGLRNLTLLNINCGSF